MKNLLTILLLSILTVNATAQETSIIKLSEEIEVIGSIEKFILSEHTVDTCNLTSEFKTICLIDGKPWFGSDLSTELPENKLSTLTLKIKGEKIDLDVTGMFNPNFGYKLANNQFKIKETEVGYTLYGFFSDGAGTYTAHWKIIKNGAIRVLISKDERDFYWQIE